MFTALIKDDANPFPPCACVMSVLSGGDQRGPVQGQDQDRTQRAFQTGEMESIDSSISWIYSVLCCAVSRGGSARLCI